MFQAMDSNIYVAALTKDFNLSALHEVVAIRAIPRNILRVGDFDMRISTTVIAWAEAYPEICPEG